MKMRKELNNKGFSLVELMIATVILAIIVAPLLHTFVTAASTTARSRQMGDATLAGKNVSEMVEARSLSQLTSGCTPDGNGRYVVNLNNVQAGSSIFDAKITLDPSTYRTGDANNKGLNDFMMSDYSNMDAVFVQSLGPDNPDVLSRMEFESKADTEYQYGWSENKENFLRTMVITVDEDSSHQISVSLEIQYEYDITYLKEDTSSPADPADPNDPVDLVPADGTVVNKISYSLLDDYSPAVNQGRWPNIYIVYYPFYDEGGNAAKHDVIVVENNLKKTEGNQDKEAIPFKLFLVKERVDELGPTVLNKYPQYKNYASKDSQYYADVEQYVPVNADDYAVIYSNANERLYGSPNDGELDGVNYWIYFGNYFKERGYFAGKHGDLVSKTAQDRVYDVTVDIYADGDLDTGTPPIHTVKSTKLR